MKSLRPTAADSDAIILALDGGAVLGVRELIRRAAPGSAESLDDMARLTAAVKRHIRRGSLQINPQGASVLIELTKRGKRKARLIRPAPRREWGRSLGQYSTAAVAAAMVAACSTAQQLPSRRPLMGFPSPVGLQQIRGADGQGYFEQCSPCAAPTVKTLAQDDSRDQMQDSRPDTAVLAQRRSAVQVRPAEAAPKLVPMQVAPGEKHAVAAKHEQRDEGKKAAVFFAYAQSKLTADGRKAVAEFAAQAKDAAAIYVRGSTDSQGDATANEILAKNRAAVVRAELITHGVERAKIKTTYCTRCYVGENDSEEGRRANRRVDLSVDPLPIK